MSNSFQTKINANWDQAGRRFGNQVFSAREAHLTLLTSFMRRRRSGAISVSGHRGVGKSALVHEALDSLGPEVLKVYVDGAKLNGSKIKEDLLRELVTRLFTATKGGAYDFSDLVAKLYVRANAENYLEKFSNSNDLVEEAETGSSQEVELGIKFGNITPSIVLFLVAGAASAIPSFPDLFRTFAATVAGALPPLALLTRSKFWARRSEKKKNAAKAELLYSFDSSSANIEFGLSEIHKAANVRIVYFIDELDKQTPEKVEEISKYLKSLMTEAKAFFVMATSEAFHAHLVAPAQNGRPSELRSERETIFNLVVYLARCSPKEFRTFLESVLAESDLRRNFARFLAFQSRCDFTTLNGLIHDFTVGLENEQITLDLSEFAGRLEEIARLQEAIEIVFEGRHLSPRPAQQVNNEEILRVVYAALQSAISTRQYKVLVNQGNPSNGTVALQHLMEFLVRHNGAKIESREGNSLQYSLTLGQCGELPETTDVLSSLEKALINNFRETVTYALELSTVAGATTETARDGLVGNLEVAWKGLQSPISQVASTFSKNVEAIGQVVVQLKSDPPKPIPGDHTAAQIKVLEDAFVELGRNLPNVFTNSVVRTASDVSAKVCKANAPEARDFFKSVGVGVTGRLSKYNHNVYLNGDNSRGVLVFFGIDSEQASGLKTALDPMEDILRVILVDAGAGASKKFAKTLSVQSTTKGQLRRAVSEAVNWLRGE